MASAVEIARNRLAKGYLHTIIRADPLGIDPEVAAERAFKFADAFVARCTASGADVPDAEPDDAQ